MIHEGHVSGYGGGSGVGMKVHWFRSTRSGERANSNDRAVNSSDSQSTREGAPEPPDNGSPAASMAQEVRLLLDVPAAHPALGFPEIAKGLCQVVLTSQPRFGIGIFGGWGSGKTTLMRAIENKLREEPDGKAVCVQFNAWRYEKEQELIVPLLDSIREALVKWSDDRHDRQARVTAGTLGRVMHSLVAGLTVKVGVPGAVDVSFDANRSLSEHGRLKQAEADAMVPRSFYHASFRALEQTFQEFMQSGKADRIVVFIDDLDRCLPENALQVLESMKLFFDFDGFVFIVGLDEHAVEYAIDAKYQRLPVTAENVVPVRDLLSPVERSPLITGAEYIKKVFQLPYRLAPVTLDQIGDFLYAACEEGGLLPSERTELQERVAPHLSYLIGDSSNVNPREIKRYINLYTTQMVISPKLDPDVVLTIHTMSFRGNWEYAFLTLLEFREEFLQHLRQRAMGVTGKLFLDEELGSLPEDLLEYVTDGAPGQKLVELVDTGNLSPYLASGEAVRSSRSPAVGEALRLVGQIRTGLANARAGTPDSKSLQSDLLTQLARVENLLSDASKISVVGRLALTKVENLRTQVSGTLGASPILGDPPSAQTVNFILDPLEASARELAKAVRRLNRAGDTGNTWRAGFQQEAASEDDFGRLTTELAKRSSEVVQLRRDVTKLIFPDFRIYFRKQMDVLNKNNRLLADDPQTTADLGKIRDFETRIDSDDLDPAEAEDALQIIHRLVVRVLAASGTEGDTTVGAQNAENAEDVLPRVLRGDPAAS
jgi:hypothetical protein